MKTETAEWKPQIELPKENDSTIEKTVQIAYFLPNDVYPYVTNNKISFNKTKQYLKLKDVKAVMHKKFASNYSYLFLKYLENEDFECYTEAHDDTSNVPFYNDNRKNKIICFLIEKI
jgi:hypothetical protein